MRHPISLRSTLIMLASAEPAGAAAHEVVIGQTAGGWEALPAGLYAGFLMATALLNLMAALVAKRVLHGWFALFVACTGLRWAVVDGLIDPFLPLSDPALPLSIGQALLGAQMVTGSLCQIYLLDLRGRHPFLLRYYLWLGVVPGAVAMAAAGSFFFDEAASAMFMALLPAPLLSIFAYRRLWRRGGLADRLIATVLPLHFLVMLPATLGNIGMLPFDPAYVSLARVASLPIILALHACIGLQARALEKERDAARGHAARAQAISDNERSARQERERLLSVIAHEVRTPVAVIDAATHSLGLLDRGGGGDVVQRERRYRSIRHAVARMRNLMELTETEELLQQPRTGALQADALDLTRISRDILDSLDPDAARRISMNVDGALPTVRGNARLLHIGLINLVDNAVKYSYPDTPIRIEVAAEAHTRGVVWSISDHGPGIPQDKRDEIFERYRRLDKSSWQPGLGLGLALSRQIVERHGGHLGLDTGWTQGACFSAWLPQAEVS